MISDSNCLVFRPIPIPIPCISILHAVANSTYTCPSDVGNSHQVDKQNEQDDLLSHDNEQSTLSPGKNCDIGLHKQSNKG